MSRGRDAAQERSEEEARRGQEEPSGLFTAKGCALGCVVIAVVVLIVWIAAVVVSTWKEPLLIPPG
jgi:hypothetical protein